MASRSLIQPSAAAPLALVDGFDVAARPEAIPLSPTAVAPPSETGANGPPAPMLRNFSAVVGHWCVVARRLLIGRVD